MPRRLFALIISSIYIGHFGVGISRDSDKKVEEIRCDYITKMTRINCQEIHGIRAIQSKELSKDLGVSENQCLRWVASGLKTVDESRKRFS